ncbi:hypothetical protein Taro_038652 [Colocasia esculenta]|uniref:Uncharacterized protein n=1 Tax=Colocasia esculenta TaxID=4460 RepID=A0A843WEH1_COLES|nr:hypothetical protein [Colocasia esculenta]
MEWSLLTSGLGRRRLSLSRSGRDGKVRRDPNSCAVFKKVGRTELSEALLDPGEELLRAIRRSGVVFDALSMRGRREEWGKRRAMRGLCVLREGISAPLCKPLVFPAHRRSFTHRQRLTAGGTTENTKKEGTTTKKPPQVRRWPRRSPTAKRSPSVASRNLDSAGTTPLRRYLGRRRGPSKVAAAVTSGHQRPEHPTAVLKHSRPNHQRGPAIGVLAAHRRRPQSAAPLPAAVRALATGVVLTVLSGPLRDLGVWGKSPMLAKGWTIDVHAPMLSTYGERPIKLMAGPKPPSSQEWPICNPGLDNEISMPGYVGPCGFYPPTGVCVVMVSFLPLKACLGGWRYVPFGLCHHLTYTLPFGTASVSVGVYCALPYQPR